MLSWNKWSELLSKETWYNVLCIAFYGTIMSNVTNLNTYESVNQLFLVRQIINKNGAYLSSGNTQIISFECVGAHPQSRSTQASSSYLIAFSTIEGTFSWRRLSTPFAPAWKNLESTKLVVNIESPAHTTTVSSFSGGLFFPLCLCHL